MSDDNKIINSNPSQAASQPVPPPIVPQTGSMQKEQGPVATMSKVNESSLSGVEVQHEVSEELKDIGVETKSDNPDLTDQHKEIGINHAGPHVPVSTQPTNSIQYPMTETEMLEKLKAGKSDDSGRGLTVLIQKVMRVMGL